MPVREVMDPLVSSPRIPLPYNGKQSPDPSGILESLSLKSAIYPTGQSQIAPVCFPQTRLAVLGAIDAWAHRVDTATPILSLSGQSGIGKTTVLRTMAERWRKERVSAIYFFTPPGTGINVVHKCLVPTLAFQLMTNIPAVGLYVERAVLADPTLFDNSLEAQLQSLIINPLALAFEAGGLENPVHVILDALDDNIAGTGLQEYHEMIIRTLPTLSTRQPVLRYVLSSRTSNPSVSVSSLTTHVSMTGDLAPEADIELFLRSNLDSSHLLPISHAARGSFIYASTALSFLNTPHTTLERNLKGLMASQKARAMTSLDALYMEILNGCPPKSLSIVVAVFEFLCFASTYFNDISHEIFPGITDGSLRFFEKLLDVPEGLLKSHLCPLHSVLDIPSAENVEDEPVTFRHMTFHDYLLDQSRAGRFLLDRPQALVNLLNTLIKHTLIILSPSCPKNEYDERALVRLMLRGFADPECPPSKDLKAGVEALLDPNDERYYEYLVGVGLGNLGRGRRFMFMELIKPQEEFHILSYLQKCNIPEIEPYLWRRWMSSLYIAPQIALLRNAFR